MGLFNIFKKNQSIDPTLYGWINTHGEYYEKPNGYFLYNSTEGWILDKTPKNAPGVILKFGKTLTEIDIKEANGYAYSVDNPVRRPSNTF